MRQHARRNGIVAAEKGGDGLGQKFLLIEAEPVLHVGDRRQQEFHALGVFVPLGEGLVALDHALLLRQAAETAVEIGVGTLCLANGEIA